MISVINKTNSIIIFTFALLVFSSCEETVKDDEQETNLFERPGWSLTWNDEFDGDTIDTLKWIIADDHWSHNGELQYYAPDDVFLYNKTLRLKSQYRQYKGLEFTSGHIESIYYQRYGRIDIKARMPGTKGLWPALWLLPASRTWPPEIDILELLGHEPNTIHMSTHWGPLPPGVSPWDVGQTATGHFSGSDFTKDFHVFSLEWYPDSLRWLIDDTVRFSSTRGIPHEPMYLIMNTAIGGFWPGSPDESTVLPQYHDIDYVRFYERDETN